MTTVVTKATGGKAMPVGALYVEPGQEMLSPGPTPLAEAGVDAAFTADLLSACLAHERCGVHLYRSVAARTTIDALREAYEHFGAETLEHVRLLEELIAAAGGDPQYVSPAARATEKGAAGLVESTYMLEGSIDPTTAEMVMLEAVMLAEAKDHANWELLAQLAANMGEGKVRAQFESVAAEVLTQEEQHYGWAQSARAQMLFSLATAGASPSAADGNGNGKAIDLSSMSRDELHAAAAELSIEGGSQMTKNELAEAVSGQEGARR